MPQNPLDIQLSLHIPSQRQQRSTTLHQKEPLRPLSVNLPLKRTAGLPVAGLAKEVLSVLQKLVQLADSIAVALFVGLQGLLQYSPASAGLPLCLKFVVLEAVTPGCRPG